MLIRSKLSSLLLDFKKALESDINPYSICTLVSGN